MSPRSRRTRRTSISRADRSWVTNSAAAEGSAETPRERAHPFLDSIAHGSKSRETLVLVATGDCGIRERPPELEPGAGRDGAVRVADRDDDVPPLADVIDGLAP